MSTATPMLPGGPAPSTVPGAPAPPSPPRPITRFRLPDGRVADRAPAAARRARDAGRLLVARPGRTSDGTFRTLSEHLDPGDLVVVNTSDTVPSALPGRRRDGRATVIHLAGPVRDAACGPLGAPWVVELRRPDRSGPQLDGSAGELVTTVSGARVTLQAPEPDGQRRLWRAHVAVDGPVLAHLRRHGRPIAYGYLAVPPGADDHRTVFGLAAPPAEGASAEPPSAALPFTDRTVTQLAVRGVAVAPISLHTGLSSPEGEGPPAPERYDVPEATSRLIAHTRTHGGRVIAVGTTVVRALESVADAAGRVRAGRGWTELVLHSGRPARVVTGLLTGWHPPAASHLALLEAVAGPGLVAAAYAAGLDAGHRWHEFGDSCLLLPDPGVAHRPRAPR